MFYRKIAFASAALMASASAHAATFYDNITSNPTGNGSGRGVQTSPSFTNDVAYGFTSAVSGNVSEIDVVFALAAGANILVQLQTTRFDPATLATGQTPDMVLGSWNITSATPNVGGLYSLTGITGVSLVAGVNYWLHATSGGSTGSSTWFDNTGSASGPLYQCANITAGCTQHISFASATTGKMRIISSAATGAVPEPTTWAMMLIGFGSMGYAMRRKSNVGTRIRLA